ncbi:MAG: S41 family peptidase [Croceivirga sp.]
MIRLPLIALSFLFLSCNSQEYQITFKVDMTSENTKAVGLRGNIDPLSENKDYPMNDEDGDGIYEANITFNTSKRNLKFRFTNGMQSELQGSDDRMVWFTPEPLILEYRYNEYDYYSNEQINSLTYSKEEIREDIDVLGETLRYIHPNIYKYIDSVSVQNELIHLETVINQHPNITTVYKEVSRFLSKIKCSHTFTNPWNQGTAIKKALFFQPDKIPLTFRRIGKRLFVDKNASKSDRLQRGWEINSINGLPTNEVLDKLAAYITADGNNYEKKLERLLVLEEDKFSLFDIFYPLEFGKPEEFQLGLSNPSTNDTIEVAVKAISKTHRTKRLIENYGEVKVSFADGWKFDILDDKIGFLSINSFAVEGKDFDWEDFLDTVFEGLNESKATDFIIDIRDNEGGQLEVVEYLLMRVLQKPFQAPAMMSTVRYEKIPQSFEKNISTWSRVPYSFKGDYTKYENGRYYLKSKFGAKAKTYIPRKDGFKGKVYLMTSAQNSSATHQMATYASMIDGIQLVGSETGGNIKGLNAGMLFFLRLPNSKVEIDVPVISMEIPFEDAKNTDRGILPDIPLFNKPTDFLESTDTVLEELLLKIRS